MSESEKSKTEVSEAKLKIANFCAYQERYHNEVSKKLYSYGLYKNEVEEIIAWLITENFLNEERFAKAYAGGKFRLKKWGRLKITQALEQRDISSYCISQALNEISEADYQDCLDELIQASMPRENTEDVFILRNKISKKLIAKGFEPDKVWERLRVLIPD